MVKQLSYADAVLLLEGRESHALRALDAMTGGLLLAGAAATGGVGLGLLDAKAEVIRLGERVLEQLPQRLYGASRFDRTERLAAAHCVVVVSAYFASLDSEGGGLPVGLFTLTRPEQVSLAGRVRAPKAESSGKDHDAQLAAAMTPWSQLLSIRTPMPAPQTPYEVMLRLLAHYFEDLSREVLRYLRGLAAWDDLDETQQERVVEYLAQEVPGLAVRRYEEDFRRLAGEYPDVGFWAATIEHRATRDRIRDLGRRLDTLTDLLQSTASDPVSAQKAGLARAYEAELDLPIISTGDVPDGLTIPSLRTAYIWPDYRVAEAEGGSLADETWWAGRTHRTDLWQFLAGHLVSTQATQAPLVVLGQPGSGKSVLTKTLSAQLPADQFLVVRVVLRDVHAETDIQVQIEQAVRLTTGHMTSWPELSTSAAGALPVVVLDGFDELLQAAGISQTDYLERVLSFQRREAVQGRPVAVIVTSRTAVADRARCSERHVVIRLEPFSPIHVEQWLAVWNVANGAYFNNRDLQALTPSVALRREHLATQPLLLLMLALYDAGGNELQDADGPTDESELYERLLTRYARREVEKADPASPQPELADLLEEELFRLSLSAVAMFSRGRQWVTETELESDLSALLPPPARRSTGADLRAPLTRAVRLLGRFFFVHEAHATVGGQERSTYEFLHATFGEYLIGRVVLSEVRRMVRAQSEAHGRYHASGVDDSFLFALLSFASLTVRSAIVGFLLETLGRWTQNERQAVREVLLAVFHSCLGERNDSLLSSYRPDTHNVPTRYALYSVNLLTLIVLMGEPVYGSELFPQADEKGMGVVPHWRVHAMFWRSQMEPEAFRGLIGLVRLERVWIHGHRDIILHVSAGDHDTPRVDLDWSYKSERASREPGAAYLWTFESGQEVRRTHHFLCLRLEDVDSHNLEPLHDVLGGGASLVLALGDDRAYAPGHALVAWLLAREFADDEQLASSYARCLQFMARGLTYEEISFEQALLPLVLRRLMEDRHRLSPIWRTRLLEELRHIGDQHLLSKVTKALQ